MGEFDFKKLNKCISTLEEDTNRFSYSDKRIINDLLYAVGICFDEDEYGFADGYDRFRVKILESINKKLEDNG